MSILIKQVAILIPAFNEDKTIGEVVKNALTIGIPIVIDDNSTDKTAEIADLNGATVLKLPFNHGYEGALTEGFKFAINNQFEYVLTMDGDGQHTIESARLVLGSMTKGIDLVIGTRLKKQRFSEYIAGWISFLIWQVHDPFSGLKLYRLQSFISLGQFDTLKLAGAELLVKSKRFNFKIKTINITTLNRIDKPRFGNLISGNFKLLRAIFFMILIHLRLR